MLSKLPARTVLSAGGLGRRAVGVGVPHRARSAITGAASQTRDVLGESAGGGAPAAEFSALPSPRGLPVVGTTLSLLLAGSTPQLHRYCDARHAQLGPVYRESIGPVDAVFVSDPGEMRRVFQFEGRYPQHLLPDAWMLYNELHGCKRGIFFMDGAEWLHFRRVMNPLLMKGDAADMFTAPCALVADEAVARWRADREEQEQRGQLTEVRELEAELYRWSIDVLVATLLGPEKYSIHSSALHAGPTLQRLAAEVFRVFQESARLALLPARLSRALHLPAWGRFERAVDRALHGASALVLELLPMARGGDGLLEKMTKGMELRDVVRIVSDLILAAGDTTAYSTQWALYLLARHQEQQEAISKELQDETTTSPLLRGAIREAHRIYPVAPFITRLLPEDCEIGGYKVPAGNLILLSMYTSGHSAANYPQPERFWPERWQRIESSGSVSQPYLGVTNPYAAIPFGFGARSCIGRKLADTQMTEMMSRLLREFRLELVNPEREVQMVLRMVSVPSEPVRLRISPRQPV